MDITERYTTQSGKQYQIRLTYNEKIKEADTATAFIKNVEVIDTATSAPVAVPANIATFSTYEDLTSFGSYTAINFLGVRTTAIESLRLKVLTRIEDYLERL